jgi:guanylate kinase
LRLVTESRNSQLHADQMIGHLRNRRRPQIFVISGPSGVGKDSVLDRLRERESDSHFAITATTREIRLGEVHGIHYYFLTSQKFLDWVEQDEFLEHALVYGNRYGVPKSPVRSALERGQDVIIKIDVQGAAAIRALVPEATAIFISPESMDSLELRLRARKSEPDNVIARRVEEAQQEMQRANEFDYVVFNETNGLLRAVDEISAIFQAKRALIHQPAIGI